MDFITNFFLSGVLTVAVWAIGATYIHFTDPTTETYVGWLKIWALTAVPQSVVISIILGAVFPDPSAGGLGGVGGMLGL